MAKGWKAQEELDERLAKEHWERQNAWAKEAADPSSISVKLRDRMLNRIVDGTNIPQADIHGMIRDIASINEFTTDQYILIIYGAMFLGNGFDFDEWQKGQL